MNIIIYVQKALHYRTVATLREGRDGGLNLRVLGFPAPREGKRPGGWYPVWGRTAWKLKLVEFGAADAITISSSPILSRCPRMPYK